VREVERPDLLLCLQACLCPFRKSRMFCAEPDIPWRLVTTSAGKAMISAGWPPLPHLYRPQVGPMPRSVCAAIYWMFHTKIQAWTALAEHSFARMPLRRLLSLLHLSTPLVPTLTNKSSIGLPNGVRVRASHALAIAKLAIGATPGLTSSWSLSAS
jgi:hypothetical protein